MSTTLNDFADRNKVRIITIRDPKKKNQPEQFSCVLENAFLQSGSAYIPVFGEGASESEAKRSLAEKIKGKVVLFCSPGDMFNRNGGIKAPDSFSYPEDIAA